MSKEKKRTYDAIIKDLEIIISKLSSENTPIDKSIILYEEGVKLSNEAEKELIKIEKNIEKLKKLKKNSTKNINIEKSFDEVENIIESLEDEDINIEEAENYYKSALEIICNVEAYLKNAKSIIKKYEH